MSGASGGTFAALVIYAFVATITPGPNNLMVLASGVNFGLRRSVPHMLGITFGFALMVVLVGVGMAQVFQAVPALFLALKIAGALYMLWLAWKIAHSGPVSESEGARAAPMTFVQAALFQWVNPKGWSMAVAATSQFILPADPWRTATLTALAFLALGILSSATWTWAGQAIGRWLTNETRHRIFNVTMAALIVLSVAQLVWH